MKLRPWSLLLPALLLASPSAAVEHTIWHSPLLVRADENDPNLTLTQGIPSASTDVTSSLVGDYWVLLPLTVPSTVEIKRIELCYRVSNAASYVDLIRLTRMTAPSGATVLVDDGTDRNSTVATCVQTPLTTLPVDGTYTLQLRLHFADTSHFFEIGAVGVVAEYTGASAPLP